MDGHLYRFGASQAGSLLLSRCPVLTLTPSYYSAVSSALVGSCIRSLAEGVGVDRRKTLLRLGLVWTAQHPHVTPATTLFAWNCIRPVLSPFLYSPLRWSNYPTLLGTGISLVALPKLISFSVLADYGSVNPCVSPLIPGNGITPSGKFYIPAEDTHLQLRICLIGHCGRGGHRALNSTLSAINDYCFWKTMQQDISAFCASRFHCISTIGGKRIPQPMGHALHSDKPNEIIHFNFLFMDASQTDEEYVLIIKDDLSS